MNNCSSKEQYSERIVSNFHFFQFTKPMDTRYRDRETYRLFLLIESRMIPLSFSWNKERGKKRGLRVEGTKIENLGH